MSNNLDIIHLHTIAGNVYLTVDNGDALVFDAGYRIERLFLMWQLRHQLQRHNATLRAVVLTHAHPDHDGNARYIADTFGVELCMHADEEHYAQDSHRVDLQKMSVLGWFARWFFRMAASLTPTPPLIAERYFQTGEVFRGFKVIATPGHTPGSASYLHEESGTLICGDAILNAEPPWTFKVGLSMPAPAYTTNMDQALNSLQTIRELEYDTLCAGHGPILSGEAAAKVQAFLAGQSPSL